MSTESDQKTRSRNPVAARNEELAKAIVANLKDTVIYEKVTGMRVDYKSESGFAAPFHTNAALSAEKSSWSPEKTQAATKIANKILKRADEVKRGIER